MNIALSLPEEPIELLHAFPFIETLANYYQQKYREESEEGNLQLHLIVHQKVESLLNLLPLKVYYHSYSDELSTILNAHRYAKNMKINDCDIFFNLTKSKASASIGINIGASTRLGFSFTGAGLVLTKHVAWSDTINRADNFLKLLALLGEEIKVRKLDFSAREMDLSKLVDHDYLLFAIDHTFIDEFSKSDQWYDFLELVKDKQIIATAIDEDLSTLQKFSNIKLVPVDDYIELGRLMQASKVVVTYDPFNSLFANFNQTENFFLKSERLGAKLKGEYFKDKSENFSFKDKENLDQNGQFNYQPFFDHLYEKVNK